MRRTIFAVLALAAVVSACGRTPVEPGGRASAPAGIHANTSAGDSAAARGGNLMGSGH